MKRPLAQEPPVAVQYGDPLVAFWQFAVGDVDVASVDIHIDAGGQEELGTVGIQGATVASSIRGVIHARFPNLEQELAAIARVFLYNARTGGNDPHVPVLVDVAIMKPVPQQAGISPATDDLSLGIELNHGRCQARRIQVFGHHILPIEDEHVIPAVDAHPAQTARDPSVGQRQLRPVRIDFVPGDRLCLGSDRSEDTDRDRQQRTGSSDRKKQCFAQRKVSRLT